MLWFWHCPRSANLLLAATVLLPFVLAVAALGWALGTWSRQRERVFMPAVASSIPLLFLTGIPWPAQPVPVPVPVPLQWLAALLPTAAGVQALVAVNQMGASLAEVLPQLRQLWALCGVYVLLAAWALQQRAGHRPARRTGRALACAAISPRADRG